jgi:hypothetical protein
MLESLMFHWNCFVGPTATKQFSCATKPFFACRAELSKQPLVIKPITTRRNLPAVLPGDGQMRTLGFMLACAFVLAGSTTADSTQGALPGVGSFTYNGSPVAAPLAMIVAARSGAID